MQYLAYALPLAALASGSFANPLEQRDNGWGSSSDACLAAVTGSAALGDSSIRGQHCASFLVTTVTPPAVTVTSTITGTSEGWDNWKRASVTVCPNEVPNYASACDTAGYSSACSKFGYTVVKTTTAAPTTTTKTVYVVPTGPAVVSGTTCPAASTVTVTAGGWGTGSAGASTATITVTVTKTAGSGSGSGSHSSSSTWAASSSTAAATTTSGGSKPSSCVVTDALASALVANFTTLLEFTSFAGEGPIPAGRGYKQDVSNNTLAADFSDISDSINFMAGFPLGSVTFPTKAAFDYGQGVLQPEVTVSTLNIWHDCSSVTWRWRIISTEFPVNGINHMLIDDQGKIQKNYAEFDNGAWLESFGQDCATANVSVASSAATKRSVDMALLRRASN